ncbi:phosphonoacetaldehyde reductase [Massiliimalia timonensis]|uniref:phosphonoacetaldehyde reductase n=1 Tax=Massiliimalia timonensis TaxID=1987501 RepID=UPI00189C6894|nr:phosphonoacetaldehyde reductase [Massiliimalia timonensis]
MQTIHHDNQVIVYGAGAIKTLSDMLKEMGTTKVLVVCTDPFQSFFTEKRLDLGVPYVLFDDFQPNPLYESVAEGVDVLRREHCDCILSIGGGSSIDVAKCINLYAVLDSGENYLKQELKGVAVPHLCIPTTAGTGSESTRFAVIYYEGEKQSINSVDCIPDHVILEPEFLVTLPLYQKKATVLDALGQAVESYWSVNSNNTSKQFSKEAISLILKNLKRYLENDPQAAEPIALGANLAGRAINITQTTAAHAMSYKVTSLYRMPHGHAVAVCLVPVWEYLLNHLEECIDPRGETYLAEAAQELHCYFRVPDGRTAPEVLLDLLCFMGMLPTVYLPSESALEEKTVTPEEMDKLVCSVNPVRLKNFPIHLTEDKIKGIYQRVFKKLPDEQVKARAEAGKRYLEDFQG